MRTGKQAAIYARISSDRDGTTLGVKRQLEDCRRICRERGWTPVEFVDNDIRSDPNIVRPEYDRVLQAVKAGDVCAVVAWDLDRLTRGPLELERFLQIADGAGLKHLVTIGDSVDPTTGDGFLVARIKVAVAAEEVAKTRKRLVRAKAQKAAMGEWNGGPLPYGRGPGMCINRDEAAVLREAAKRVLRGESLRGIALDLSDRGLGPRGKRWAGGSNLAQRLTAPHVAGLRAHHGELTDATWKPILPRETWEKIRALRADPSRRTRVGAPSRMLLTGGLMRCAKCGAPLRARPRPDGTRRYGCPPEGNHGYGCGGVTRDAAEVEAYVVEAVLTRLEAADIPLVDERVDVGALHDEVERIDAKLSEFAIMYADDSITRKEFDAATNTLRDRRKRIEQQLGAAHRQSSAATIAGRGVRDRWDSLTMDQQRAIIAELIPGGIVLDSLGRGQWRIPLSPKLIGVNWFDAQKVANPRKQTRVRK